MDMALNDAVAVGKKECCLDSRFVPFNPSGESEEFGNMAGATDSCGLEPEWGYGNIGLEGGLI